jgi:hypothetical protein
VKRKPSKPPAVVVDTREEKEPKHPYRFTKEERETHLYRNETEDVWMVDTCSKPFMTRLDKWATVKEVIFLGGEVVGKVYEVPKNCVSIHKPRKVTEAQKEVYRQRALAMKRGGTKVESVGLPLLDGSALS